MEGAMISVREVDDQTMRSAWGWFLALGILLIILGIVALTIPVAVSVTMAVFLGIILLVAGIVQVINAFVAHRWKGFFAHLLGAAILLLFGAVLLADPERSVRALTLLLAIYFVVAGLAKLMAAVAAYGQKGWGWVLFGGIVSFILGILIWSQWPSNADWVIGLLVGIDLFLSGWGMVMMAIAARSAPPPAAAA